MSDQPDTTPESAQQPADAIERDDLVDRIAREVTLTWRAIEEVDVRLATIELELVALILTGLVLLSVCVVVIKRPRSEP